MTAQDLLADLKARDVRVAAREGKLAIDAPRGALTPELVAALREQKDALVALLSEGERTYPLTLAQHAFYMLEQLAPGRGVYELFSARRVRLPLDASAVELALGELVARHAALRTTFRLEGGSAVQVVSARARPGFRYHDFSGALDREHKLEQLCSREQRTPFDLASGPLIDLQLARMAADDHVLTVRMHHIVSDAASLDLFFHELLVLYRARTSGQPAQLPPVTHSYAELAALQDQRLSRGELEPHVRYWQQTLRDLPPCPPALGRARDQPTGPCHAVKMALPTATLERVRALARDTRSTPFVVLLAAYQLLLARWADSEDVALVLPVSGRDAQTQRMFGLFVSNIALRALPLRAPTVRALIEQTRLSVAEGLSHQEISLEALEGLLRRREQPLAALSELPRVAFNHIQQRASTERLSFESIPIERARAVFELMLIAVEADAELELRLEYRDDAHDASSARELLEHYAQLLDVLTVSVDLAPAGLCSMPTAELLRELALDDADFDALEPAPTRSQRVWAVRTEADAEALLVHPCLRARTYDGSRWRPALRATLSPSAALRRGFARKADNLDDVAGEAFDSPALIEVAGVRWLVANESDVPPAQLAKLANPAWQPAAGDSSRVCLALALVMSAQAAPRDGVVIELIEHERARTLRLPSDCSSTHIGGSEQLTATEASDEEPSVVLACHAHERELRLLRAGDQRVLGASTREGKCELRRHAGAFPDDALNERVAHVYEQLVRDVALDELDLLLPHEPCERSSDLELADRAQTLLELIIGCAQRDPHRTAIVSAGRELSYGQLLERVERMSAALAERGVAAGSVVGVRLPRTEQLLVSLLAIMHSGAAYLPLDPRLPAARVELMLERARAGLVIGDGSYAVPAVAPDELASARRAENRARPDGTAYVMFTSGSSGQPKGVVVPHAAVANFLRSMAREPGLHADDALLAVTTYAFDISVLELFLPLTVGARVVLADEATAVSGEALARELDRHGISVMQGTPNTWRLLLAADRTARPNLRALCGGEPLSPALATELTSHVGELWNVYGPTETTVWITAQRVVPGDARIPVGAPVANTFLCVLDGADRPLPRGYRGHVHVGGRALATGYVGDPEQTNQRFPRAQHPRLRDRRLYRTGDLGMIDHQGTLHVFGRLDRQVKLRGYRIELGEIEHALRAVAGVSEAVVQLDGEGAEAQLIAFAQVDGTSTDEASLRDALKLRLPPYAVPARIVTLPALRRLANGKLDVVGMRALSASSNAPLAAKNELEAKLIELWRSVLGDRPFGTRDNFFDVGGHSLVLMQVQRGIEEELGVKLEVATLFRETTIERLARLIESGAKQEAEPARVRTRPRDPHDEIAIVGMACNFPGAPDLATFWSNLSAGRESITRLDPARLASSGVPAELLGRANYVAAAAVLDAADSFDAALFRYLPSEAALIDPQQRLLLQCAYAALEDAACDPFRFQDRIGVYAGVGFSYYLLHHVMRDVNALARLSPLELLYANDKDYAATRIAYKLNLRGPCVTVGSACSTGLVAVHQACQALRSGSCELALAATARVATPQERGYLHMSGGILSADGHCRAFDARADGTVFGNGVGAVVLKRRADAERDGDAIYCLIKGSSFNNDGSDKIGYTAPSLRGQVRALREAYRDAEIDPCSLQYVETHGTGTKLGDAVELAALKEVFQGSVDARIALGAVKTNFGHLDTSAGMAGLIKTALSLHHAKIPATLHFERANPALGLEDSVFDVNTTLRAWSANGPRRAGVSSFGIGGANAHVVLEAVTARASSCSDAPALLLLSANSKDAVEATRARLHDVWTAEPNLALADVAYTLGTGRPQLPERSYVIARNAEQARRALREPRAPRAQRSAPPIVFLLPDHRDAYAGMARPLYEQFPTARAVIERGLACLGAHARAAMLDDDGALEPALHTIFQVALADLWASWGVRPNRVFADGSGALAAGVIAGAYTLEEVLRGATEWRQALPLDERALDELVAGPAVIALELGAGDVWSTKLRLRESSRVTALACWPAAAGRAQESEPLLRAAGEVFCAGHGLALSRPEHATHVHLPSYPFAQDSHALQTQASSAKQSTRLEAPALYEPSWRRAPVSSPVRRNGERHWILTSEDCSAIASALSRQLQASGATVVVHTRARHDGPEDIADALTKAAPDHIQHLLNLAPRDPTAACSRDGLATLLALGRALGRRSQACTLNLITRGAERVFEDEQVDPTQALTVGALRVVARELTHVRTRQLDLDPQERDPARIANAIATTSDSGAYRQRTLWCPQFVELPERESTRKNPKPTFVLTGGLGGVARMFAAALQREYDAQVVLIGRAPYASELGAGVSYHCADVCDEAALRRALDTVFAQHGRIDAVMHAAGVADGKLIALRTAADDARILAPKLDGTANLLGLLRGRDVGRVILFSSVTALTAEPGQFAYAAANAYLDACAESERELNVLSIAWDTFAEVGMACDAPLPAALADERARRLALGLRNDEAFAVLVRALGYPGRRLIVSTRELTTRLRALEAGPATTKVELSRDRLRDELLALWRESFGVPDLDAETDFFDAGGSSLQAVQLAHRVRERLGVALAPDALLHHATVDALADFLSRPDEPAAAEETLVCLQAGDAALAPLFLLHPVGGEVFVYQELVKQLGTEHPVYGLRQAVAQVGLSVPELARQHRARIERVYDGPYHLAGSSFGGTLALEIARCRAEEGRAVASLTLIDTPSGELLTHRLESERDVLLYLAADLPAGSKLSERALAAVDDAELFDYFAREASTQLRGAALGPELLRRYVSALRSNDAAMRAYALPTYAGPLLYIKAISRRPIYDPARPELPFKLRYPQLVSVAVEGNHVTMHAPPHVNALARALRTQLHPTARDADRYETGGTR